MGQKQKQEFYDCPKSSLVVRCVRPRRRRSLYVLLYAWGVRAAVIRSKEQKLYHAGTNERLGLPRAVARETSDSAIAVAGGGGVG